MRPNPFLKYIENELDFSGTGLESRVHEILDAIDDQMVLAEEVNILGIIAEKAVELQQGILHEVEYDEDGTIIVIGDPDDSHDFDTEGPDYIITELELQMLTVFVAMLTAHVLRKLDE